MRMRGHAKVELLTAKELRLKEALKRQQHAMSYALLRQGAVYPVNHNQSTTSITLLANLWLLLDVPSHVVAVTDPGDDLTGGYSDVLIPAGRQICVMAENTVLSLVGQPSGSYFIYAQHDWREENPVVRDPPGLFLAGDGATPEHTTFFAHGHLGEPVPRGDFDADLEPTEVSERVDRISLGVALEADVPVGAYRLLQLDWNGAISNVVALWEIVNLATVGDLAPLASTAALEAHIDDEAGVHGATASNVSGKLIQRDADNRAQVSAPVEADEIANKFYVDTLWETEEEFSVSGNYRMPPGSDIIAPGEFIRVGIYPIRDQSPVGSNLFLERLGFATGGMGGEPGWDFEARIFLNSNPDDVFVFTTTEIQQPALLVSGSLEPVLVVDIHNTGTGDITSISTIGWHLFFRTR